MASLHVIQLLVFELLSFGKLALVLHLYFLFLWKWAHHHGFVTDFSLKIGWQPNVHQI